MAKVAKKKRITLLPEFISNIFLALNSGSRTILLVCESSEHLVTGLDEVATSMLKSKHEELMLELGEKPK